MRARSCETLNEEVRWADGQKLSTGIGVIDSRPDYGAVRFYLAEAFHQLLASPKATYMSHRPRDDVSESNSKGEYVILCGSHLVFIFCICNRSTKWSKIEDDCCS